MAYTTIDDPTAFFQAVTYTGNGATGRSIVLPSDTDMQPDWVWVKSRGEAEHHQLTDSVRGVNKQLYSHLTYAEATETDRITAFNSDGFTIQDDIIVNKNSIEFVAWCWKAGTSFTNDASSTGIGTIDSTGSFSNDSGFSIVTYTGTGSDGTIKHGLNAKPKIVIWKRLDNAAGAVNWIVQSTILGNQTKLVLNTTEATSTNSSFSQTDNWTSALLDLKTYEGQNASNGTYVAYCFVEKQGFSSIGTYIGNGNNDGTFAYTGFRPAFVMIKKAIGSTENWYMVDNKRNTFNIVNNFIKANTGNAGNTSSGSFNFFSNGFKNNDANGGQNESGHTYLYMAFAENPFVTSTGIPTNAR